MHADYPHRINFKKPGMHRPAAGALLVLKLVVYIEGKSNVVTVGTVYSYLLKIKYSMMNKTDMSVRIYLPQIGKFLYKKYCRAPYSVQK